MRAVLYTRVSTAEQTREGVSLDAQEERLKDYCKLQGLDIVKIIREEGISAKKRLEDRPGGKVLFEKINSGEAKHVVALKLDRVFRNAIDALTVTQTLEEKGISLHLVDLGGISLNSGSAMGKMMLTFMAGMAEMESNLISERTKAGLSYKKDHKEVYSNLPYGYTNENNRLKENGQEIEAIKLIYAMKKNEGLSLRKIAAKLTDKGYKTKKGGRWHANTIKKILDNTGLYEGVL